jgi:hypothetical protein
MTIKVKIYCQVPSPASVTIRLVHTTLGALKHIVPEAGDDVRQKI